MTAEHPHNDRGADALADVDPVHRRLASDLTDQLHAAAATVPVPKPTAATVLDHPRRRASMAPPRLIATAAALLVIVGIGIAVQRVRSNVEPTITTAGSPGPPGNVTASPAPCRGAANPATDGGHTHPSLGGAGIAGASGVLALSEASTRQEHLVDGALFDVGSEPRPGQAVIPSSGIPTGPVLTLRPADGKVSAPWVAITTTITNVAGAPPIPAAGEVSARLADGREAFTSAPTADVSRVRFLTARGVTVNIRGWDVSVDDLLGIASSVTVAADGSTAVTVIPRGTCLAAPSAAALTVTTSSATFATAGAGPAPAEKVTVALRAAGSDGLSFEGAAAQLIDRVANGSTPTGGLPSLRATTVNGHSALLRLEPMDGRFHVDVVWEQRPGALVGIATLDVTTVERVAPILAAITTVDDTTWQRMLERCPTPRPDNRETMPPTTLVGSC